MQISERPVSSSPTSADETRDAAAPDVEIIVCVHNSPRDVDACLTSIAPSLTPSRRLLVVDDGSDEETRDLCRAAVEAHGERARLIRRPEGSGFCRAANNGLRESAAEVVILLNSDTVVGGDWIDRMLACFRANPAIGLVGPLSNAASWQSIPEIRDRGGAMAVNPTRSDPATLAAIQTACEQFLRDYDYPFVEVLNGFCLGVKRDVMDAIGYLDEELFPMGYGEENDFCFRAIDAGFQCAVALDCFVFHGKTKSYTDAQRRAYSDAGRLALIGRHGSDRVRAAVASFVEHPTMKAVRERARGMFAENGWLEDAP